MRDCPHKGENIVLYTGTDKIEAERVTNEARNCSVLDSGCSSTIAGKFWMDCYLEPFLRTTLQKSLKRMASRHLNFVEVKLNLN